MDQRRIGADDTVLEEEEPTFLEATFNADTFEEANVLGFTFEDDRFEEAIALNAHSMRDEPASFPISKSATFPISKSPEFRFIRITQTDKNDHEPLPRDTLACLLQDTPRPLEGEWVIIKFVEFFGTLHSQSFIRPVRVRPDYPRRTLTEVEFPESGNGVISYLTRKHGGNVHDKGIVTITSKSVKGDNPWFDAENVADLTDDSQFRSKNDPGQWIC
jgi:hypothetical protein